MKLLTRLRQKINWWTRERNEVACAPPTSINDTVGYDKRQKRVDITIVQACNGSIINCDGRLWLVHPGEPLLDRIAVVLMDNKLS
jgi:hypothetical protein